MELVALVLADKSQETVLINPLQVRFIKRVDAGSRIEFDEYHHLVVRGEPSAVAKSLKLSE